MRRPRGKRKYSHAAWLMISIGNRYPAYRTRADVIIPPDYSPPCLGASGAGPTKLTAASSARLVSGWCLIGREVRRFGVGIRPSRPDSPDGPFFLAPLRRTKRRCQPLLPAPP